MRQIFVGILLYAILVLPPIRLYLESIMVTHMLVQLPLLIFTGWLISKYIVGKYRSFFSKWNTYGVPGIIFVAIVTTYWMIPRTLDEALTMNIMEIFKFISLPIVGLLIRDSWKKLEGIGKSFIYLNYLSMFGLMAWLYIDSPIQICNNYLETEQKILGWGMLVITACMIFYFIQYVFTDHTEEDFC
ncbi:hypothetical protein [Ornithinibacillus halophilus]|uniref:Uncharacterized protein n=1 Tax=Ornithinibacillus halophilus TaxID=930117 RepID=A0A1M5FB80_9BACI|nr:hypothetical protein [Ornithinibacillus halophilus]SHF88794.1 hypothetical protein SAMN05216225_10087 [Ornithinibacillus halophilus]